MTKDDFTAYAGLLEGIDGQSSEAGFDKALVAVAEHFGFRYVAYVQKGRHDTINGRFPDGWPERYVEKDYGRIDPLFRAAFTQYEPVRWSGRDFLRSRREVRRFFAEARDFGVGSGLLVPLPGAFGAASSVSFTGPEDPGRDAHAAERAATLRMMCTAFDASYRRRSRTPAPATRPTDLSGREAQVLAWVSRGKSLAETAEILGIHGRTVALHVANAKAKLDAASLPHAVVLAIRHGAVSLD